MADSIKKKYLSGVAWTLGQNILVRGASFVFTIILARILSPEDYGLIGMLSIFITISQVFISSGFGEALIQKEVCTEEDYSTAFYFNIIVSLLAYIILFFSAPYISAFYYEEKLCLLLRVLALNFIINSLTIVQSARMTKEMNFRSFSIINFLSTIISGIVGVILAYTGFGVWALVVQTIFSSFVLFVLFVFFNNWLPKLGFSMESFRHLWNYGSKLIVTGLISVIQLNLSSILIGRFYKSAQVGYYTRAQSFGELPSTILFSVFSSVTFPTFCKLQNDRDRLLKVYKRIIFNIVLITCPIILCLVLLSKPLILILLTDKWLPCVPLLQWLLLARMFLPIGATQTSLLRSIGRTDLYMKLYFVTAPLSLLSIIISISFGVRAMAMATFIAAVLSNFISSYIIGKLVGYGIKDQIKDWRRIFLSLSIMCIGVYLTIMIIPYTLLQLVLGGLVGFSLYTLCCYVFSLVDADIIRIVKSYIKL